MTRPTPRSSLFPYTALFRSRAHRGRIKRQDRRRRRLGSVERAAGAIARGPKGQRRGARFDSIGIQDRKSTRLNSSHMSISYAVFCLKKKKKKKTKTHKTSTS